MNRTHPPRFIAHQVALALCFVLAACGSTAGQSPDVANRELTTNAAGSSEPTDNPFLDLELEVAVVGGAKGEDFDVSVTLTHSESWTGRCFDAPEGSSLTIDGLAFEGRVKPSFQTPPTHGPGCHPVIYTAQVPLHFYSHSQSEIVLAMDAHRANATVPNLFAIRELVAPESIEPGAQLVLRSNMSDEPFEAVEDGVGFHVFSPITEVNAFVETIDIDAVTLAPQRVMFTFPNVRPGVGVRGVRDWKYAHALQDRRL